MFKGKAIIELTDVNTNNTEVYEEENLVTNAVKDIFSLNPSGLMYPLQANNSASYCEELFPIANKCYGGILIFEDRLDEDPNKYTVPSTNSIIGYASDNVNPTDYEKRGSANLTESKAIENGYKFVWDFSTSQANGKISSLALTHYKAGKFFYGDKNGRNALLFLNSTYKRDVSSDINRAYSGMVEADIKNNTFTSIFLRKDKTLEIVKFKEDYLSVGLTNPMDRNAPQKIEKTVLDISKHCSNYYDWNQWCFYDGKDGYWYGFFKGRKLSRIKIKKSDYSFTADEFDVGDINFYYIGSYSESDSGVCGRSSCSLVKDGYLYTPSFDKHYIYKININNPVDITKIDLGFVAGVDTGRSCYNRLYQVGDYILCYNFQINSKDEVIKSFGPNYDGVTLDNVTTPLIEIGPFRLGYGTFDGKLYKKLFLHTPYLGTINNLSTPILKTADKTMKITYTLTEEEGNE